MQAAVVWQQQEMGKRGKKEKVRGKKRTSIRSSIVTDLVDGARNFANW